MFFKAAAGLATSDRFALFFNALATAAAASVNPRLATAAAIAAGPDKFISDKLLADCNDPLALFTVVNKFRFVIAASTAFGPDAAISDKLFTIFRAASFAVLTAFDVAASVSLSLFVALLNCTIPFCDNDADGKLSDEYFLIANSKLSSSCCVLPLSSTSFPD
ncbi:Uncharacterised protein [Yersinia pseudotuberculosis]|nr:Uncharacterised protein [Yersinia pseudotuberculosis]